MLIKKKIQLCPIREIKPGLTRIEMKIAGPDAACNYTLITGGYCNGKPDAAGLSGFKC